MFVNAQLIEKDSKECGMNKTVVAHAHLKFHFGMANNVFHAQLELIMIQKNINVFIVHKDL